MEGYAAVVCERPVTRARGGRWACWEPREAGPAALGAGAGDLAQSVLRSPLLICSPLRRTHPAPRRILRLYQKGAPWRLRGHRSMELPFSDRLLEVRAGFGVW